MACKIAFLTSLISGSLFVVAEIFNMSIEKISVGMLLLLTPYAVTVLLPMLASDRLA
ncbi:MAG: hypothetical protein OXU22_04755 [Gammaproteobacteria bacterium]|nr:hypothetical protein [Gammaproteobacteria bacterium]